MARLKKRTPLTTGQDTVRLSPETVQLIKVHQGLVMQHKVTIAAIEASTNALILKETGLDTRVDHVELDLETGEVKRA